MDPASSLLNDSSLQIDNRVRRVRSLQNLKLDSLKSSECPLIEMVTQSEKIFEILVKKSEYLDGGMEVFC